MKTHVTFILDSSGSMDAIREDTIGGFNSFLNDQQTEEGRATVSLYEFSDSVDLIYENRAIEGAPKLSADTYIPGGQTALHDAIYISIYETKHQLDALPEAETPDTVVLVILTDGKENASETSQSEVQSAVATMREEHGWEFLFIGANQDAALTAQEMGMEQEKSLDMAHTGDGAKSAYQSTSEQISQVRDKGHIDGYDDEDRSRQDDARDR